jgi:hypothetical protein
LQSRDCSYYESRRILTPLPLRLKKHADLGAYDFAHFAACNIRLGLLKLPALEAGDFVKLIILYLCIPHTMEAVGTLKFAAVMFNIVVCLVVLPYVAETYFVQRMDVETDHKTS